MRWYVGVRGSFLARSSRACLHGKGRETLDIALGTFLCAEAAALSVAMYRDDPESHMAFLATTTLRRDKTSQSPLKKTIAKGKTKGAPSSVGPMPEEGWRQESCQRRQVPKPRAAKPRAAKGAAKRPSAK